MTLKWIALGAPLVVVGLFVGGLMMLSAPEPASPHELAEFGIGYYKAGKVPEARTVLLDVLQKDPNHFRTLYGLGLIEFEAGNLGLSERYLKQALKLKPNDIEAYLSLGAVYQRGKAFAQAEQIYLAILKKNPKHVKTLYNLGRLYVRQGKLAQGKDYLLTYLKYETNVADKIKTIHLVQKIENRLKEEPKK